MAVGFIILIKFLPFLLGAFLVLLAIRVLRERLWGKRRKSREQRAESRDQELRTKN